MGSRRREQTMDDFLKTQWNYSTLWDVQLHCGHHIFQAHQLVLAAYSRTLRDKLTHQDTKKGQSVIINLTDTNITPQSLHMALKYLYTGELDHSSQSLQLLKLAAIGLDIPVLEAEVNSALIGEDKKVKINHGPAGDQQQIDFKEYLDIMPKEEDCLPEAMHIWGMNVVHNPSHFEASHISDNNCTISQSQAPILDLKPEDVVTPKKEPVEEVMPISLSDNEKTGTESVKSLTCGLCARVYSSNCSLLQHITYRHERGRKPRRCTREGCDHTERDKYDHGSHVSNAYDRVKLPCSRCWKRFNTEFRLKNHEMEHDGIYLEMCPKCGRRFENTEELNMHMSMHKGVNKVKPHVCKHCSEAYYTSGHLAAHKLICKVTKVPKSTGGNFVCEECGKRFFKQKSVNYHKRAVHNRPEHTCRICGNVFMNKGSLRMHLYDCRPDTAYKHSWHWQN